MNNNELITVVGGGLAGVEAAWTAACLGAPVRLYEMRPNRMTPAHQTGWLAELVCSNSFKSMLPQTPAGQLKAEMLALGSVVLPIGERESVPGGEALAVDRERFAAAVTCAIEDRDSVEVVREEVTPELLASLPRPLIIATGPLTTEPLAKWLAERTGAGRLHFYDAVSPTVEASSLDRSTIFAQSRYGKGEGDDYLNCPFDKEQYLTFVRELVGADRAPLHEFEATASFVEQVKYFSGCMPIEAIAERGEMSLAHGNFKPVGLVDPRTGRRPYAALQLRPENREKTLYSMVGCQTRLKWGEQRRVFRMVPGLGEAEFVRFGVIHRNTYIDSPHALGPTLELQAEPDIYVAGQLTGVEGYVESAAMGILAGMHAVRAMRGLQPLPPPRATALGSLMAHLQDGTPREFAPMNINWGLLPEPDPAPRGKHERHVAKLEAANAAFSTWREELARA